MAKCPHCSEEIRAEAKVCRHCKRGIHFAVRLTQSLNDRQKYEFMKKWQALDRSPFEHLSFENLSHAKEKLDQLPLLLGWDMSQAQVEFVMKELMGFPISFSLEASPSSKKEEKKSRVSRYAYAATALLLLGGMIFYFLTKHESPVKETVSILAPLEPPAAQKPILPQTPAQPEQNSEMTKNKISSLLNATVFIGGQFSLGTGFFISDDGYVLSNRHVTTQMANPIVILRNGKQFRARKIAEDPQFDISLLKIDTHSPFHLKFGDANDLYPGQTVITIGNPGGLSFTVTRGIISYVGRNIKGVPYIQTDAAINRGNSGGPMITPDMKVVGINTLTSLNEEGISFSLPINLACADGGIVTKHLYQIEPCSEFQPEEETGPGQVAFEKPKDHLPDVDYQKEANQLKKEFDRDIKRLQKTEEDLRSEKKSLDNQIAKSPNNLSLRQRLKPNLDRVNEKLGRLPYDKAEFQLRYVKQIIDLLKRQKLDPRYAKITGKIDAQIEEMRGQKLELEDFLEKGP